MIIEAVTPPELNDTAFDPEIVKSFLVPGQSVQQYSAALAWKEFKIVSQIGVSLNRSSMTIEAGSSQSLSATVTLKHGNKMCIRDRHHYRDRQRDRRSDFRSVDFLTGS